MMIECRVCGSDMDWVDTDVFLCSNSECGNRESYDSIFPPKDVASILAKEETE